MTYTRTFLWQTHLKFEWDNVLFAVAKSKRRDTTCTHVSWRINLKLVRVVKLFFAVAKTKKEHKICAHDSWTKLLELDVFRSSKSAKRATCTTVSRGTI